MAGGFVKKSRDILSKPWYNNLKVSHLHDFLMLSACYSDYEYDGMKIKAGSYVSTIKKISEDTPLSEKEVRNALKTLERYGEITVTVKSCKYHIIMINGYADTKKAEEKKSANPDKPTFRRKF